MEIPVESSGMETWKERARQSTVINAVLKVGGKAIAVTVAGDETEMVTTNDATLSTVIERKRIEQRPLNGRAISDLVYMITPGLDPAAEFRAGVIVRVKLFAGILAMCLLPLASIHGQDITGIIVGQVTDPSSSVIPDAEITVRNEGTGIAVRVSTDASGTYSAPSLPARMYEVSARKAGFQAYKVIGIQLPVSQAVRQDVKLQVGEIQQTFSVIGQAPLIHTDSPTIGGSLTSRQISELPLGGQAIDGLIQLDPGALWIGRTSTLSNRKNAG